MENNNNPVENVLEETLKNLRTIIDVDCIVGKPIVNNKVTIIPISKVSVGFVSGGGEYNKDKRKSNLSYPFAGGSGGGCNLTPIGFLSITDKGVDFIKITPDNNIEKIIDIANNFVKSIKN